MQHIPNVLTQLPGFLLVMGLLVSSQPLSADDDCAPDAGYSYICGPVSAEDMVRIPDSNWVIASGFSGDIALYLIDADSKSWRALYPADEPLAKQNMTIYGACPGSPDPGDFTAHGLTIRAGRDGHSTLYVVGHGEREAVEIFDIDATGDAPVISWTGCVTTPAGMAANSVAALADGSLLVTIPLHTGFSISDILSGQPTGAAYAWQPGDAEFSKIEGTEMPYANGIEVSADGEEFYIASSGLQKVLAFSNENPARRLRSSDRLSFIPDNLHRNGDGQLITAGLEILDPVCGNIPMTAEFDFPAFASCPRPFSVVAIDPASMRQTVLASSAAQNKFSNITMALEVGDELWIGTFAGDRIAVTTPGKRDD